MFKFNVRSRQTDSQLRLPHEIKSGGVQFCKDEKWSEGEQLVGHRESEDAAMN